MPAEDTHQRPLFATDDALCRRSSARAASKLNLPIVPSTIVADPIVGCGRPSGNHFMTHPEVRTLQRNTAAITWNQTIMLRSIGM